MNKKEKLKEQIESHLRKWGYQQDMKNIDWSIVEQGLETSEMIIGLSITNGNYTIISWCPTLKRLERQIVFQWMPIIVDFCRGCEEFHFRDDKKMKHDFSGEKQVARFETVSYCVYCGRPYMFNEKEDNENCPQRNDTDE